MELQSARVQRFPESSHQSRRFHTTNAIEILVGTFSSKMNRRTCWRQLGLYVATQKMALEESRSTELNLGLVMALDRAIMQESVEEDPNASASCQQNESSWLIRSSGNSRGHLHALSRDHA
jgi:hypothetical protein